MPAVPDANKGSERRTLAIRLGTVSFGAALEEEDRERRLRVERMNLQSSEPKNGAVGGSQRIFCLVSLRPL